MDTVRQDGQFSTNTYYGEWRWAVASLLAYDSLSLVRQVYASILMTLCQRGYATWIIAYNHRRVMTIEQIRRSICSTSF